MSEDIEHLANVPEMQDFIDNIHFEVGPNQASNDVPPDTNTLNTVLEVAIAINT
jgi:hypothetical protein